MITIQQPGFIMIDICRSEIVQLHIFIEGWLNGTLDKIHDVFERFEGAFDEDFLIVHPSGQAQIKSEILADIWEAHGKRPKPFAITIKNVTLRTCAGPLCLVTYEEWQSGDTETTRLSSVLFKKQAGGDQIRWLHLHETFVEA
jgi:hypothetical protein